MTDNRPGDGSRSGWDDAPWQSSLSDSSLAKPTPSTEPPSPFSREGSDPDDALGAQSPASPPAPPASAPSAPAADPWPSYPPSASQPDPAPYGSAPANPYGQPSANPYGQPSANPYGQPSANPAPQPPAPGFDPQPTAPYPQSSANPQQGYQPPPTASFGDQGYGSQDPGYGDQTYGDQGYGQPAAGYGTNPYEVAPYQPSYGGYSPYGVAPIQHPKATPALICGIIGLVLGLSCGVGGLVGIAGIVLGGRARKEIDADPQRYTGRGMASAGWGLGIASLVVLVGWVVIFTIVAATT